MSVRIFLPLLEFRPKPICQSFLWIFFPFHNSIFHICCIDISNSMCRNKELITLMEFQMHVQYFVWAEKLISPILIFLACVRIHYNGGMCSYYDSNENKESKHILSTFYLFTRKTIFTLSILPRIYLGFYILSYLHWGKTTNDRNLVH